MARELLRFIASLLCKHLMLSRPDNARREGAAYLEVLDLLFVVLSAPRHDFVHRGQIAATTSHELSPGRCNIVWRN